jgi:hypothetical protein
MVQLETPQQKKTSATIVARENTAYSNFPIKIIAPHDVQHSLSNMAVMAATTVDMNVIQAMLNSRIKFEIKERDKDEGKTDDILERRAEVREVAEKEKKAEEREEAKETVLERIEERERIEESAERNKEQVAEEIAERQEQVAEFLEERMRESETDIKESLEDVISIFEETGLAMTVESIHQMVEEGEMELAKEQVEELVGDAKERQDLVKELEGEVGELVNDKNVGADKVAIEIDKIAEKDNSELGEELKELSKEIEQIAEEGKERLSGALEDLAGKIEDIADTEEGKLGEELGDLGEALKALSGEIKEMTDEDKDRLGDKIDGIVERIEDIADKEKGKLGEELEGLSKELKELSKEIQDLGKEDAIDRVKDFIEEHAGQIGVFKEVERLLDRWDRLSQKQIADALKDASKELMKETAALEKGMEELRKLAAAPDDFIKKAKRMFSDNAEMLDSVRRKWIGAVIDFTKEKFVKATVEKDKAEAEFWKDTIAKTSAMKGRPFDEFNKRFAELMKGRSKDLQAARVTADRAVIDNVSRAIEAVEEGRYADKLGGIARMADKKEMRPPLERLAAELHEISERTEALLRKAQNGDLDGVIDELRRPDGQLGPVGRIMVRTIDRNRCKAKKEIIKELLGGINMINGASRMAEGIQKAMEKKDYELVDEMCTELKKGIRSMKQADKEISAILGIKRMPRKERRSRIAKVFAKLIFVKRIRPANN